jgi:hypothetical protein
MRGGLIVGEEDVGGSVGEGEMRVGVGMSSNVSPSP